MQANREIINNQDIDARRREIMKELLHADVWRNVEDVANVILDLELQLRDALCDLRRAKARGFC